MMSRIRLSRSVTVSTYRLLQVLVVLSTLALFCYLLLFAMARSSSNPGPDYSWLKTRNMSAYLRPEEGDATTLLEPVKKCRKEDRLRMVVMVFSAPAYFQRRDVVRRTWGKGLRELPGVKLFFLMGVGATKETQVLHDLYIQ